MDTFSVGGKYMPKLVWGEKQHKKRLKYASTPTHDNTHVQSFKLLSAFTNEFHLTDGSGNSHQYRLFQKIEKEDSSWFLRKLLHPRAKSQLRPVEKMAVSDSPVMSSRDAQRALGFRTNHLPVH